MHSISYIAAGFLSSSDSTVILRQVLGPHLFWSKCGCCCAVVLASESESSSLATVQGRLPAAAVASLAGLRAVSLTCPVPFFRSRDAWASPSLIRLMKCSCVASSSGCACLAPSSANSHKALLLDSLGVSRICLEGDWNLPVSFPK